MAANNQFPLGRAEGGSGPRGGTPVGLFVLGTDTGVGKTWVTAWIARHLRRQGVRVGVAKPAVTGAQFAPGPDGGECRTWGDIEVLRNALGREVPDEWISAFRWTVPLAPPAAERWDAQTKPPGQRSGLPRIADYRGALDVWRTEADFLVIEGIGGLLCPLTDQETLADLVVAVGMPALVVARLGLGTLNHTLLTLAVAERMGIRVAGVVLNRTTAEPDGLSERTNPEELRRRVAVPVWGPLPFEPDVAAVPAEISQVDWRRLAGALAD